MLAQKPMAGFPCGLAGLMPGVGYGFALPQGQPCSAPHGYLVQPTPTATAQPAAAMTPFQPGPLSNEQEAAPLVLEQMGRVGSHNTAQSRKYLFRCTRIRWTDSSAISCVHNGTSSQRNQTDHIFFTQERKSQILVGWPRAECF